MYFVFAQLTRVIYPRLLRHRSFYGPSGKELLSAGLDRSVRSVSMIRDAQNVELSQGSIARASKKLGIQVSELKLPPVVAIASGMLT